MTATGGRRFLATDPTLKHTLMDLVVKATKKQRAYSYRFHYKAKPEGPNPRTVQVALKKRPQIRTSVNYPVPAEKERVPPTSVTGLYLTISVGGITERRHLGGIQWSPGGSISQDPFDPTLIAEAQNALNGLTTVTVEPASPTLSAVLDDVVTSFQSMEPLVAKKWTKDDVQAFKAAAAKVYRYPMDLAQLLAPPPVSYSDPNVVPQGLRILVSTEQPQDNALISRIDIPPGLNQLRISEGNPRLVSSVVRSSLWLSANEALAYDQSAFAQLQGRPLHLMDRYTGGGGIPEEIAKRFSPEDAARLRRVADQYIDYIRLVPTDGGTVAMWVINHESGTVMAVGETGRGEGSRELSNLRIGMWGFIELLGFCLLLASTHCETGLSEKHPFICASIAAAGIAATVGAMFASFSSPDYDPQTFAAALALLLDANSVPPILKLPPIIDSLLESIKEGSSKNPTKVVILLCITFLLKMVAVAAAMGQVGDPPPWFEERKSRSGSQGSSR